MPTVPLVPTVRRRQLGGLVRQYRKSAGMSGEAVAVAMRWDPGKISRIENAKGQLNPKDVPRLLGCMGVEDAAAVAVMEALARDAGKTGWWQTYSGVMAPSYADLISLERDAHSVSEWSPLLIPGLLQTSAYAREAISSHALTRTADEVAALAEVRVTRQSVLTTRPERPPLKLRAVISESVLHQRFAVQPELMQEQVALLIARSRLPNVTIQVMPLNSTPHPGGAGAFSLFGFPHPMPDVVQIENLKGSNYAEGGEDVTLFDDAFNLIVGSALSVDDSLALLKKMEKWKTT
ncbi:helix-turn-helix domain-containing protein (plasmid) [Streptomyces sp. NBC_01724]|uniref:helix-turn-helix domain-containing protein n=1 Tax=Streptomyces sp. NBC_01724 TaxID=2975922 RepID=UPI002E376E5C|nr:helix-turn-helix transcriptional regulator [Streptomyces sp. NBC_01724]